MVILIGLLIAGIGAGLAVGIFVGSRLLSSRRTDTTAAENLRISEEAKRSAEAIRREAQVEAREEALKLRAEVESELREKRAEIVKRDQAARVDPVKHGEDRGRHQGRPDDLLRFRHGTHPGRREELTDRATQSPNAWTDLFALARAVLALDQASNFLFRKAELEDWQKICSSGNRVHSR